MGRLLFGGYGQQKQGGGADGERQTTWILSHPGRCEVHGIDGPTDPWSQWGSLLGLFAFLIVFVNLDLPMAATLAGTPNWFLVLVDRSGRWLGLYL